MSAARDLGVPITLANRIGYRTARGLGKDGHDLLCFTTTAESGGHFVAVDLSTRETFVHPLNHLEAYPIVLGGDGCVYTGSTSGEALRWNPKTDQWGPVGAPLFRWPGAGLNHVRCLCEGPGGWLYAGSVYGERARIHRETGEVQKLPPTPEPGNWYVSACETLPDGKIAFGYGHTARLFVYDPTTGKDVGQWLPKGWTEDGFCLYLSVGKSVVYVSHFPSGRRGAFDAATGKFLGQAPWPDAVSGRDWSAWPRGAARDFFLLPGTDTIVAYAEGKLHQYDPRRPELPPSAPLRTLKPDPDLALEMRYDVTTDGEILVYDRLRQRVVESFAPKLPTVARNLFALGTGPDGGVYGGAYQSTLLFRHDPKTGQTTVLGDHHPGWSGETFCYACRGDELLCASYTNGAIVAYHVKKPWKCSREKRVNPRRVGFLGQRVYRPTGIAVAEDGRIWGVGPAGWGTAGGGIAVIDARSGKTESTALPEAPTDLLALPGNRLLACSHGLVRWWDGTTNREIAQAAPPVPLSSATALEGKPSGRALLASTSELLVVSADEPGRWTIHARVPSPVPAARALLWKGFAVVGGPQGFATVDLSAGKARIVCTEPLGSRYAFTVAGDAVYFHRGPHLLTAPLTAP